MPLAHGAACPPSRPAAPRHAATMGEAPEPSSQASLAVLSKVELRVSCRHLLDRDTLNKSDPCVLLLVQSQGQWVEVDRSEVIKSNLNPVFAKIFTVDYYFEEVQKLRFEVYDSHGQAGVGTHDDDFLGGMECTVGQIVAQKRVTKPLFLKYGKFAGKSTITVISEEISGNNGYVELAFRAKKLDDKDLFSKSDPFLEIYRIDDDSSEQLVYRTEVVKNNLSPIWEPFKVSLNSLCSCEEKRKLRCVVWDYDSRGKHDFIGEFFTTFEEMQKAMGENKVGTWGRGQRGWCSAFGLAISPLSRRHHPRSPGVPLWGRDGWDCSHHHPGLGCGAVGLWGCSSVGLGLWGRPRAARVPHVAGAVGVHEPQVQNQEAQLQELGGRGAAGPEDPQGLLLPGLHHGRLPDPLHAAPCTTSTPTSPTSTSRHSWQWVRSARTMTAIRSSLLWASVRGSPPSMRCPTTSPSTSILTTMSVRQYFILLILTDGVVTDMADTREAIVRASYLPMSIIIVGVGNADFTDMQILDGDDGVLRSPRGEPVLRDIVQFVPFRDFKNASPTALAKCVLAEVPKQVVEYYSYKAFPPRCPQPHTPDSNLGSPQ
ncbi:copine-7 isoform X2 [Cyrtonyx montezumae]|uniref:copine-7 isoform X2 n=1 Tax=Cyrtonyx montezumae TaxID=9017 RepID=UPI0032DAFB46